MGRLITEEAVEKLVRTMAKEQMCNNINATLINAGELIDRVYELPTAYDVDKVIEEIKEMSGIQYDCSYGRGCEFDDCIHTPSAIEIVRKGGV